MKADKESYEHDLFKSYKDPLCLSPGVDHPLAVGTEMREFSLYDILTSSAGNFKRALENNR